MPRTLARPLVSLKPRQTSDLGGSSDSACKHPSQRYSWIGTGAYLDDLLYCPHHPETGWPNEVVELKIECACRKPRPGMLLQAARSHNLDLSRSWMIGDRYADIAAAHAAGARGALVKTGHAGDDKTRFAEEADGVFDNLSEAFAHIIRNWP